MYGSAEITVSELNLTIADAIRKDQRLRNVTVKGEISGFKHHIASGHWYFSLKDAEASVSCVMFRQNTFRSQIRPKDGDSVAVTGYVDVYPRSGSCQLYVTGMRSAGLGDLYLRFEALKRRLDQEGLFDPARKKPLPMVPRKVAVVTSASGAAIHDILNVSGMRNPAIPIVVIPAAVQGAGAAEEIAEGIRKANRLPGVDVIIVGRGGGSPEDLWCFNEECVARAVAESRLPVVSGVGHEIDTSICDLAADVRASTPSNAAEIVFPDRKELEHRLNLIRTNLKRAGAEQIRTAEQRIAAFRIRLSALSPERRISGLSGRTELALARMSHAMNRRMENEKNRLRSDTDRLRRATERRLEQERIRLTAAAERLSALNPLGVLDRGYALVYAPENQMITSAKTAREKQELSIRFADGWVDVNRRESPNGRE
ncbi:MAG: exodeoxyribonuclease VII large subunit [Clostridia bacterium]|nr:exodeoxyribonuclease VII large subunit [Clostridia bacterium]